MTENQASKKPIGIFDSGVGGLTVMEAIVELLPDESIIYYADSGNCPYGEKSREEIFELASHITEFLIRKDCKAIVVACNTITTNIIDRLREKYPVPFIGMEPAIKPAALQSSSGKVAVLATKGTLNGELYQKTRSAHAADIEVLNLTGTGLVELIERNEIDSPEMMGKLENILSPLKKSDYDALVLGCTHYNYLVENIRKVAGGGINILTTAVPVARQLKKILTSLDLLNRETDAGYLIYTTGDRLYLNAILKRLTLGDVKIMTHIE